MASLSSWVATTANVLYPYGVILGFIATAFTVVFAIVKFRSLIFKLFAGLRTSKQETERRGGVFARIFRSLDETKAESKAAQENTQGLKEALLLMTEALVEERKASEVLQESRDVEAKQNDELLARTLRTLARYDQAHVLERLGALEGSGEPHGEPFPDEDDDAGLVSITGRHRLHSTAIHTISQAAQHDQ